MTGGKQTCAGTVERQWTGRGERTQPGDKEEAGVRPAERAERGGGSEFVFGEHSRAAQTSNVLGGNGGESSREGERGDWCIGWHSVHDSPSAKISLPSENPERG